MTTTLFSQILKKLRTEKGISQTQLAQKLFVDRSTITRWENGSRLPNNMMISRISKLFGADINLLLNAAAESDESLDVILVDDSKIILQGAIPVLEEVLPNATICGFTRPSEAVEYAKANRIALALLDIELGKTSGLDLCRTLLEINPRTNVIYLTAYTGYAYEAWSTGACGFMRKPLTVENVQVQLKNLRYPFLRGSTDE